MGVIIDQFFTVMIQKRRRFLILIFHPHAIQWQIKVSRRMNRKHWYFIVKIEVSKCKVKIKWRLKVKRSNCAALDLNQCSCYNFESSAIKGSKVSDDKLHEHGVCIFLNFWNCKARMLTSTSHYFQLHIIKSQRVLLES